MYGEGSVVAIIAALNEEEGIGLTIAELRQHLGDLRVLVVDGRSIDRTVELAKNSDATVVFQEDVGKGDAIARGIREVDCDVEYVVLTDADYTYPAEYIPMMLKILDENRNVGMVCGNRFNSHFHLRAMNNSFYAGNRMLALAHNLFNGVSLRDPLTGLRVVRWEILKDWKPKSKGFDVEVELNHLVENKGFTIAEVPIHYRDRLGEKKLKLRHGFRIFNRILAESVRERV
ncbi:MAG: glycosyltransferase family 2 protein [Candidatus Bathyarchaeia archaeon]